MSQANHIIIVGQTCSGKTTLARALAKIGYWHVKTTTTRPIRPDETQADYCFVSDEQFELMRKQHIFAETSTYPAAFGQCSYASPLEAYFDKYSHGQNTVVVLNPEGIHSLEDTILSHPNIFVVMMDLDTNVVVSRAHQRQGYSSEEMARRIEADSCKFDLLYGSPFVDLCVNEECDPDVLAAYVHYNATSQTRASEKK